MSAPSTYGSQGNRLMPQVTRDGASNAVIDKRWYTYDIAGRVTMVMRKPEDGSTVYGTRLYYDTRGNIWMAINEQWQVDGSGNVISNSCTVTAAMEYRCDSARGRYMVRPRSTSTLLPAHTFDGAWYDHDGDGIWNDYSVSMSGSTPSISNVTSQVPGMAMHNSSGTFYLFSNHIGTTERIMNTSGEITRKAVFTAFGERIYENGATDTRYGYAGAFGYEAPTTSGDPLADLGWLHVGKRYYDPSSGRFVQRDPIGIWGGFNTYAYCLNYPVTQIDPSGKGLIAERLLPPPGPFNVGDWPCGPPPQPDAPNPFVPIPPPDRVLIIPDPQPESILGPTPPPKPPLVGPPYHPGDPGPQTEHKPEPPPPPPAVTPPPPLGAP